MHVWLFLISSTAVLSLNFVFLYPLVYSTSLQAEKITTFSSFQGCATENDPLSSVDVV